jgi:DivIVA domain-containing protein
MRSGQFPRTSRLRKGYHRKQVDAFLSQVEVALGGGLPLPSAVEVRQAGFELVRGGYDTRAVDERLDQIEERVLVAQSLAGGRRGRADPASEVDFLKEELGAPYMRRFPRAGAFRRGYDADDVDDFIDRVVAELGAGPGALTVDEVRAAPFRPRRGGYREDAVDDMLDRVVELLLVLRRAPADGSAGPVAP